MITWYLMFSASFAQAPTPDANGQLLRPSSDSEAFLWSDDTHVAPSGYGTFRSYAHYAHRPMRIRDQEDRIDVVSGLAELDLMGAYTYQGLRLGAHLPVLAYSAGELDRNQGGLGDLALDLKGRVLDRDSQVVGLSIQTRVMLPTSSVPVPVGDRAIGWEVTAIVDKKLEDWLFTANIGTRNVPRSTFGDQVYNDPLFGRIGAAYSFMEGTGVAGELGAQTNWSPRSNPGGTPAELLASGFTRVNPDWMLRGGAGIGLSRSPGAPVFRALIGVAFEPDAYPDRDLDGIVDKDDWCPNEPEDKDNFTDWDGCADRSIPVHLAFEGEIPKDAVVHFEGPETVEFALSDGGTSLHGGVYQMRVSAPGFEPILREIVVPATGEIVLEGELNALLGTLSVFAVDAVGKPLSASVRVSGGEALAVGEPIELSEGEHAVVITAPGFLAKTERVTIAHGTNHELAVVLMSDVEPAKLAKKKVRVEKNRIELDEKIFFSLNEATIEPRSHGILMELASTLKAHPKISGVEVAGHTDTRGSARYNRELSAARAQAVRDFLVGQGVDPTRLKVRGYGSDEPIVAGDTDAAHDKNRRVEFRIQG